MSSLGEMLKNIDLSQYQDIINPESWSNMSLENIVVCFLILVIAHKLFSKAYMFVGWCIELLIFIQICYWLGLSALNDYIPFSDVFKYDVGVSFANFFSGTKIAEWMLWLHEVMRVSVTWVGNIIVEYGSEIVNGIDRFIKENPAS